MQWEVEIKINICIFRSRVGISAECTCGVYGCVLRDTVIGQQSHCQVLGEETEVVYQIGVVRYLLSCFSCTFMRVRECASSLE